MDWAKERSREGKSIYITLCIKRPRENLLLCMLIKNFLKKLKNMWNLLRWLLISEWLKEMWYIVT